MRRYLLIHYGEIGLKGANKEYFLNKLRKRILTVLEKKFRVVFSLKHSLGRFLLELPKNFKEEEYVSTMRKIFGVKNFKFVYAGPLDFKKLGEEIWKKFIGLDFCDNRPKTFKVKVKRSMKLKLKSFEAERDIGEILIDKGIDMNVKLKNPEFTVDIEFFNDCGYFSFKKYKGAGGLSSNSAGKLVSLISSGIDSPVASYLMMRRGARVIFVHFHGYPYTDKAEMNYSKELVKILSDYQFDTKMYLVPFGQLQKKIATNLDIPGKVRTVLYRRMMLRIAEKIAKKEKAKGLITGDNFGQVASQTSDNIYAIHEASSIPLFQPLIGFDKEEIIEIAEKIETFEISKLPCKGSCTMFAPKNPELKANVYDLLMYEKNLPIDEWVNNVVNDSEVLAF